MKDFLKYILIVALCLGAAFWGGFLLRDAQWQIKHDKYITDTAEANEEAQKLVDQQMANDIEESEKRHYEQLKETKGDLGVMRDQLRTLNERLRQQTQATNHCEAIATGSSASMGIGPRAEYQNYYDTLQRSFDESSDDAITLIKQRDYWKDRANILESKGVE